MAGPTTTLRQTTVARAAKSKKPLSDVHQLQRAVRDLQREAADQLVLEVESQATFEFLTSQLRALRSAFETLSDVLMNELDGLRRETHKTLQDMDAHMTRQGELHKATHAEVSQLKRAMEVWGLKERDWAKDNEILKASHAHNVEWMQQLQRDVMDVKDKVHEVSTNTASSFTELNQETGSLREHWARQVDDVLARLDESDARSRKRDLDVRALAQQRVDDLELMEQALNTVQSQQVRARESWEDHADAATSQLALLAKKVDACDAQTGSLKSTIEQLRIKTAVMEREQRRRLDSVGKMLAVRRRPQLILADNDRLTASK